MKLTKSGKYVDCEQFIDEDLRYLKKKEINIKSNRADFGSYILPGKHPRESEPESSQNDTVYYSSLEGMIKDIRKKPSSFDSDDLGYEPDEFDNEISSLKANEADFGEDVSHEDRAFQVAMEIGEKYDWDFEEVKLLANVFNDHGWSFTKRSIINELELGMTFNEFKLAVEIRKIWQSHTEFSICYSPFGSFGDISLKYKSVYNNPHWSFCLKIIRGFDSFPDPEEMEQHFISLYTIWRFSSELRDQHFSYYGFIRDIVSVGDAPLDILAWQYSRYEEIEADYLNRWRFNLFL